MGVDALSLRRGRQQATYHDLRLQDEDGLGISMSGESPVWLETCHFRRNGQAGIAISGAAKPSIVRNICTNSNGGGILVWEVARTVLNSNGCTGNETALHAVEFQASHRGRQVLEQSGGRCRDLRPQQGDFGGNVCQNNRENGITGNDHAVVRIEDDTTTGNRGVGIGFWGSATGRSRVTRSRGAGPGTRAASAFAATRTCHRGRLVRVRQAVESCAVTAARYGS